MTFNSQVKGFMYTVAMPARELQIISVGDFSFHGYSSWGQVEAWFSFTSGIIEFLHQHPLIITG